MASATFPSLLHAKRYYLIAVAAIDSEIIVQREHLGGRVNFREPDEAGVCH